MNTVNVVNVKVKYIRPMGYENLKEWINDRDNNVYIGRAGIVFIDSERYPKKPSKYCNPFKVSETLSLEDVLVMYEEHLQKQIDDGVITTEELVSLQDKNLGCWCKEPGKKVPCHGDILRKYIKKAIKTSK